MGHHQRLIRLCCTTCRSGWWGVTADAPMTLPVWSVHMVQVSASNPCSDHVEQPVSAVRVWATLIVAKPFLSLRSPRSSFAQLISRRKFH